MILRCCEWHFCFGGGRVSNNGIQDFHWILDVPLVHMPATCSVVRTYFMVLDLSKLMFSSSQLGQHGWVRETCLEFGPRPMMIMLVTLLHVLEHE